MLFILCRTPHIQFLQDIKCPEKTIWLFVKSNAGQIIWAWLNLMDFQKCSNVKLMKWTKYGLAESKHPSKIGYATVLFPLISMQVFYLIRLNTVFVSHCIITGFAFYSFVSFCCPAINFCSWETICCEWNYLLFLNKNNLKNIFKLITNIWLQLTLTGKYAD